MGWLGPASRVRETVQARVDKYKDTDEYCVRGGRVVNFLGVGEEFVIDDDVEVRVNGEWQPLIPLLTGGLRVTVI